MTQGVSKWGILPTMNLFQLFCLSFIFQALVASENVQSRDLNFVDAPGGFDFSFSKGLPQRDDVWWSEIHYTAEGWLASPISVSVNSYINDLTLEPLVKDENSHVILMKTAFIVRKPVQFLTREIYLKPQFHVDSNPGMDMKLLSTSPLVFEASRYVFGSVLINSNIEFKYFDRRDFITNPSVLKLTRLYKLAKEAPSLIIFRQANKFNRVLQLAVSSSELYPLDSGSSLVVSYIIVSVEEGWVSGLRGPFAKSKLREIFREIISESIQGIENVK